MFFAPRLIFGGTGCGGSIFHVLRSLTRFWRYRVSRVLFSCFALHLSFLAVPRASGPVFLFCVPGLIFGGSEGVGSRFNVLHAQTRVRWYRGRRLPFSCFALQHSYSAVPRTSGPVFMFCTPGLIFGGTDSIGSRFQVLRSRTHFRRCGGHRV
jgi:hypothetical protein